MSTGTLGMNDTLRDSFTIEMRQFVNEMEVLQEAIKAVSYIYDLGFSYIGPRGPTVMLLALSTTGLPLDVVRLANEDMLLSCLEVLALVTPTIPSTGL